MTEQHARIESVKVEISRTKTWGGLDTQPFYGPGDAGPSEYSDDLNDPGEFPFTRGISSTGYRKRMWTLRNIVGYGAPEDTRQGIRQALAAGSAGINVVVDALTQQCIDPDHPAFGVEVGSEGCSIPCARDMARLMKDIDITQQGIAFHATMMVYPVVVAAVIQQGRGIADIRGSHMPDHLSLNLSGWGNAVVPADLGHRTAVDNIHYSVKNTPRWALGMPQAYDLRERGLTPAGEIAVGMAIVSQTLRDLAARGLSVADAASHMAWVSTADIDFFEEVAKFRALRRVWAKTLAEQFGVTDPRALGLRIACHTAGKSLVYQQPLNNLSRAALQSFAALCGGVQSLEACTYDEPIGIPTEHARELATRTQQILAHEVGAARTADPLGGSYYVEALTDAVEAEARELQTRIEAMGLIPAVSDGYIERLMDDHNLQVEQELQNKARVVIGVNDFIPEPEAQPKRFRFDRANTKAHVRRFAELKRSRDHANLQQKLRILYQACRQNSSFHQAMIDALIADGSIAEVWGTVRQAHGLPYDPFKVVESPFDIGER